MADVSGNSFRKYSSTFCGFLIQEFFILGGSEGNALFHCLDWMGHSLCFVRDNHSGSDGIIGSFLYEYETAHRAV